SSLPMWLMGAVRPELRSSWRAGSGRWSYTRRRNARARRRNVRERSGDPPNRPRKENQKTAGLSPSRPLVRESRLRSRPPRMLDGGLLGGARGLLRAVLALLLGGAGGLDVLAGEDHADLLGGQGLVLE